MSTQFFLEEPFNLGESRVLFLEPLDLCEAAHIFQI
jgi:hypothetical protein